jgi:hypothetical protein
LLGFYSIRTSNVYKCNSKWGLKWNIY